MKTQVKPDAAYTEKRRQYRQQNKEKIKAYKKSSYQTNSKVRLWVRDYNLKKLHGIGLEQYLAMYSAQAGCCAICSEHKNPEGRDGLVIDHDHATGRIRSLLCAGCNKAIGFVKESAERARKLADYIEKHHEN